MDLTEDDVLEILDLIEKSSFDYFELELGELKLVVSKGEFDPKLSGRDSPVELAGKPSVSAEPVATPQAANPSPEPDPSAPAPEIQARAEGLVPVTAPMVGTFYAAPDPESPPFVEKGQRVEEGTTLGLIEVMKVFTSVKASVGGVISEVLVTNAQFIEYGQDLFLIEPDGPSDSGGKPK